jgi:hypothetical protein
MNDRAKPFVFHPALPQVSEGSVRPKVMRRPAQFASRAITPQPLPALLTQVDAPTNTKTVLHTRAWQDDGRFAMTLLAIIIVINVAVSAWLSAMTPLSLTPPASIPLISSPPSELKIVHILDDAAAASSNQ